MIRFSPTDDFEFEIPDLHFRKGRDWEWKKRWAWFWYNRRARVLRPIVFWINGKRYEIPIGYLWNHSSIGLFKRNRALATLLHDYLYHMQHDGVTREMADAIFVFILREKKADEYYINAVSPISKKDSWFDRLVKRQVQSLFRWAWKRNIR